MIGGAVASILSYFTGDEEADRLWDTMSPAAQEILLSTNGPDYLSHAILGHRLMYAFLILAAWRVMLELSTRLARTRIAFLIVAIVAAGALLYQGKTGGELVYEHGVGMARGTANAIHVTVHILRRVSIENLRHALRPAVSFRDPARQNASREGIGFQSAVC
jgi:uncharacterized membrane protein